MSPGPSQVWREARPRHNEQKEYQGLWEKVSYMIQGDPQVFQRRACWSRVFRDK